MNANAPFSRMPIARTSRSGVLPHGTRHLSGIRGGEALPEKSGKGPVAGRYLYQGIITAREIADLSRVHLRPNGHGLKGELISKIY